MSNRKKRGDGIPTPHGFGDEANYDDMTMVEREYNQEIYLFGNRTRGRLTARWRKEGRGADGNAHIRLSRALSTLVGWYMVTQNRPSIMVDEAVEEIFSHVVSNFTILDKKEANPAFDDIIIELNSENRAKPMIKNGTLRYELTI